MRLYSDLAGWYRLVDPPADHVQEAEVHRRIIDKVTPGACTLLELGSGAGHNAVHLKAHFRCTLTDVSEPMLALNRELNPECEHLPGDMRSMRLGRTFDAVLVHDAVMYMTTRGDLLATARTAYEHTRPGGCAIFQPDCIRETFKERTDLEGSDAGARSARFLMWTWDPDPGDDTYVVDFAFLFRHGAEVRAEYDRHVEGVFARATWLDILARAGYEVESVAGLIEGEPGVEIFVGRRR